MYEVNDPWSTIVRGTDLFHLFNCLPSNQKGAMRYVCRKARVSGSAHHGQESRLVVRQVEVLVREVPAGHSFVGIAFGITPSCTILMCSSEQT